MKRSEPVPVPVIADTREPCPPPWRFSPACRVIRRCLPTGDYSVDGFETRITIERKTLPDFVACCCSAERDRFVREIERLATFEVKAILVEANVEHVVARAYRSLAHPNSIMGPAAAFLVDHGVPVIWAGDAIEAAAFAERVLVPFWNKQHQAEVAA